MTATTAPRAKTPENGWFVLDGEPGFWYDTDGNKLMRFGEVDGVYESPEAARAVADKNNGVLFFYAMED